MDIDRIEALLRTRSPRERTYAGQLPELMGTTPPGRVTVRVRGASSTGRSTQALALVLTLVIVAGSAAFGVWHLAQTTGVGGPAASASEGPGIFSVTGSMTTPRVDAAAALLSDGRVLIVGGFPFTGGALASAELYDPATGKFDPTGSMSTPRWDMTATRLSDGRILIAGGSDSSSQVLASADIYDPATGTFAPTGSMGSARTGQTATLLPDGRVLIAGGEGEATGSSDFALATAELFDPTTGKFSPTGSMEVARSGSVVTLLLNGRVLIAGGYGTVADQALSSAELYDPATGRFSPTGNLTVERAGATATLLADGRVLVAGGQGGSGSLPFISAELYDPATGTFRPTGSMDPASPRDGSWAIRLNDGRVLILGGVQLTNTAELYDPATGSFTSARSMASERSGFTATLLPDGRVLIAGGSGLVAGNAVGLASAGLYEP
jgi:hypothetical protein